MKLQWDSLKFMVLASAVSSCLLTQGVNAQTTGRSGLDEIVVTARRVSEDVQTVPLSVAVQTGGALEQHHVTDIYSLSTLTPSLQVQAGGGGGGYLGAPSFSIRGVGTAVLGDQVEPSVGVVVDDIPMARPQMATIQLFDIDNVQTLSGPQGMLFGKNVSAGLVNIVTKDPVLGKTDFAAQAQYGKMNTSGDGNNVSTNVMGNFPLGETAALRLNGFYSHTDGYVYNVQQPHQFVGQDLYGGRLKFQWAPGDAFRLLLAGDYAQGVGAGETWQPHSYNSPITSTALQSLILQGGQGPLTGPGVLQTLDAACGITASPENDKICSEGPAQADYHVAGVSLKAEYEFRGGLTVTNLTGYRSRQSDQNMDIDATPLPILFNSVTWGSDQFSEELRLTSPQGGRFTYQGGLFYMSYSSDYHSQPGPPLDLGFTSLPAGYDCITCLDLRSKFDSHTSAAYAEGEYKLLDKLRWTLGARYTHDELRFEPSANTGAGAYITFYPTTHYVSTQNKDNLSWRTIFSYDVTSDIMTYASYAKGYKAPTFEQITFGYPNPNGHVGQEIPENYELGIKSTWLDRKLRFNLSIFDQTFHGYQTQIVTNIGGSSFASTVSAGELQSRGAEMNFTVVPLQGLTIGGGATYLHTEYKDVPTFPCYLNQTPGTGRGQCDPATQSTSINGNQLARAPDWTVTLNARYGHRLWEGWNGFIQGDGYFRSSWNFDPRNDPHTEVGSTNIYGASIGMESDDGRWSIAIFGRNLSDVRVPLFLYQSGVGNVTGAIACPALAAIPQLAVASLGCGDNRPPATGDYSAQFGPDSFRTVGMSVNYRL